MQEKKEKIDKKNKHFQCFRESYLVQSVKNPSYGHYQKILAAARQRGGQGENNYVTVFQKNDFLEVVKIATEI